MPFQTPGLHHVTATTDRDQADLDFFVGTLGLRLVKTTVNFDNPAVYHFYYANGEGAPGTVMTTFPYGAQGTRRGLPGAGVTSRIVFSAPADAQAAWARRLGQHGVAVQDGTALGRPALWTTDPSGLPLAIAFGDDERTPAPGLDAGIALRGIFGVQVTVREAVPVGGFLRDEFGMTLTHTDRGLLAEAGGGGPGRTVEVVEDASLPPAVNGIGTVHHVAFRVPTEAAQAELRRHLLSLGLTVTEVRDRSYFRSIYFRDPVRTGEVLFEVATDGPGFATDEAPEALGHALRLPPGLDDPGAVAAALPPVDVPRP